jgi:iron complex outermembrane receptor protein
MSTRPFADGKAAFRASGSWRTHDGYVKNTFTGDRVEDQDTRSGRLQLAVQPQETLRLLLTVDGTRDRGAGPAQHVLDLDDTDPLSAFWTVDRDRKHTAGSTDGYQNRDTWGVRGQMDWDLSFATLTYLGSYRDLDYTPATTSTAATRAPISSASPAPTPRTATFPATRCG